MGLEEWLRSQQCILLFQWTQILFQTPILCDSQLPVNLAPEDLMPSSDLCEHCTHVYIPRHRFAHIYNKNKINLFTNVLI